MASTELRRAGPLGAGCANDLDRLLVIKSRVQHQSAPTSSTDSAKAVERARRLVAAAAQVAAG